METTKSLEYGKCQETWKRPNSLSTECSYKHEKRQNPLNTEIMTFVTDRQTHTQLLLYINHHHNHDHDDGTHGHSAM